MSSKGELRQKALSLRRSIPPREVDALSAAVQERMYRLKEYASARTVATYAAQPDEVQTAPIIQRALSEGRRVLVPKTDPVGRRLIFSELRDFQNELEPGLMGILEPRPGFLRPVSLAEADLILVPVVAWDERGYRLGRGGGYFDRELAALEDETTAVGLALEIQRVAEIPAEKHDVPLAVIITEERVVRPLPNRTSRSLTP